VRWQKVLTKQPLLYNLKGKSKVLMVWNLNLKGHLSSIVKITIFNSLMWVHLKRWDSLNSQRILISIFNLPHQTRKMIHSNKTSPWKVWTEDTLIQQPLPRKTQVYKLKKNILLMRCLMSSRTKWGQDSLLILEILDWRIQNSPAC
jgi:hypothetical protein